ncbi:(Fe-S)-binding protein [Phragmitibacter flavus]|uniref:Glycolate oxidase iron-sulfur subunit n=1 Tax=Phragmitibacter flavus TaxID=2576071 RepID=A0A5R8KC72_9BACT|nr:(Fe-S)-binding protein [Phragmitibacter flavus]TLD69900.1 (Fe-S)-binding protein [Phragmitibacter flavus]
MATTLKQLDYSVLQQCMHCGMCLPTCPTYVETKRERNSPRGRIALMRSIADGETQVTKSFGEEMYYCLGCLACVTACPAGVNYVELFETARADVERKGVLHTPQRGFWRWLTLEVLFMRPRLLRAVGMGLRWYQRSGVEKVVRGSGLLRLLPEGLRRLEPQTPVMSAVFSNGLIEEVEEPVGVRKYRVALLTGCVQDLAFAEVNRDTADVLLANGCEVVTPSVQPCCGSLHGHNGAPELAMELARRQLDLFEVESLDAIISNAGGCGSHLKHYGPLLKEDARYAERARLWDSKVRDVHEWLAEIGFRVPSAGCGVEEVTYHESCHLTHGQKVVAAPRLVLGSIPGLKVVELPESNWCCGSAGIYNITQPEQSAKLLKRKVEKIAETGVPVVATSNPGCHLQIAAELKADLGNKCKSVTQPVTLLAQAYRNERSGGVVNGEA